MALGGASFLALWNDIARGHEDEYDQWHTLEHVPERVAVTGFRGARRYVNRARTQHCYFTLYDVDSLDVFRSAEYRDLLENPTPWSASMRPHFGNFLRVICSVAITRGTGIGAALATLCVDASIAQRALEDALAEAQPLPRVNAVHLGRTHEDATTAPFAAPPPSTAPLRRFDRVALVEALDRDAATAALGCLKRKLDLDALPADFGADVYDLAFVFPGSDPGERLRHRRREWDAAATQR